MAQRTTSGGLLITLEGGEGSGKSAQAEALAERIEAQGRAVVRTREPGGTPLGERLRTTLLDLGAGEEPLAPMTEALLFIAARAELLASVIAPALERGEVVLCDRFADSTTVYQGFASGVDEEAITSLNAIATADIWPDLTVLLDLPVAQGLARAGRDPDRFERETEAFHERVRRGYLALAEREPERWIVVDAAQPIAVVTEAIWQRLEPLL